MCDLFCFIFYAYVAVVGLSFVWAVFTYPDNNKSGDKTQGQDAAQKQEGKEKDAENSKNSSAISDENENENEDEVIVEDDKKDKVDEFGSVLCNSDPFWCGVNPRRILAYHKMVLAQNMKRKSVTSIYSKTIKELMMESLANGDNDDNSSNNGKPVAKRMIWKVKINNVGKNFRNKYSRFSDGIGIILAKTGVENGADAGVGAVGNYFNFNKSFCGQSKKWKYFGISLRDGKCHHSEKQYENEIDNDDDEDKPFACDYDWNEDDEYDDDDGYDSDGSDEYTDNYYDDDGYWNEYDYYDEDDKEYYGFKKGDTIIIDFDIERGILSFYSNDSIDGKVLRIKNFLTDVDINGCRLAMDICDNEACYFVIDYQCEFDVERAVNANVNVNVNVSSSQASGNVVSDIKDVTNKSNISNMSTDAALKKEIMRKQLLGMMQQVMEEFVAQNSSESSCQNKEINEEHIVINNNNNNNNNESTEMKVIDGDEDNEDIDDNINDVDDIDEVDIENEEPEDDDDQVDDELDDEGDDEGDDMYDDDDDDDDESMDLDID